MTNTYLKIMVIYDKMKLIVLILSLIVLSLQFKTYFELDGNALTESTLDWDQLTNSDIYTGVVTDPAPLTIFTTGGSKDTNDVDEWQHTNGSVPHKDDITNAYAYADTVNGSLIIYTGADRFAKNGDSAVSFWFFQDDVQPQPDGSFSGTHKDGDLLVIQNFGQNQEVTLYEWLNDGIVQFGTQLDATCNDQEQLACAISNFDPTPSPWPYTPKSGTDGIFPEFSFLEGAVNLSQLYGENIPCFTSFMAVTRASTSLEAQLKDFVSGSFDVCRVEVTINCTGAVLGNNTRSIIYSYEINVSNNGFGKLYDVEVFYNSSLVQTLPSIDVGEQQTIQGEFVESNLFVQTSEASVLAYPFPNKTGNPLFASSNTSQCPVLELSPQIVINKTCLAYLAPVDNMWVVHTNFSGTVCNTGDLVLDNVVVVDNNGTPFPEDDKTFSLFTLSKGACQEYSGSYIPNSSFSGENLFNDTVTVTGMAPFGLEQAEAAAHASCVLCV